MTILDVDAVVRGGRDRVATLDLSKSYDKVKKSILIRDCEKPVGEETAEMLTAYLQVLPVSTKVHITGKVANIRLVLTQGAPLSSTLFLIYTNYLADYCQRRTDLDVVIEGIGHAEVTLTADYIVVHTEDWCAMQPWLEACSRWAYKKDMKWENSKYTVICMWKEEVDSTSIRLYIRGGEIRKAMGST